jgi:hypothetical protein
MNGAVNGVTNGATNGAVAGVMGDRPRSRREDLAGCRTYTPALARFETNRLMNQNQWRTR